MFVTGCFKQFKNYLEPVDQYPEDEINGCPGALNVRVVSAASKVNSYMEESITIIREL